MVRSHGPLLASLMLAASLAGTTSRADVEPASLGQSVEASAPVDPSEAGRVYLSQSLAALEWARRYGHAAARAGRPAGFDVDRYLAELDTIAHGVERYLRPDGPPPGPLTSVEITGHFLLEGLRGQGPRPAGDSQP